jgi:hypothetical protein
MDNHLQLMTPDERDALLAEGRPLTWRAYSDWRFGAIDPHAAIRAYFHLSPDSSLDTLKQRYGDMDAWPFEVRLAVKWLTRLATEPDWVCPCFLCERRITHRLELGMIALAWPDEPGFPEGSRAAAAICATCRNAPGYKARLQREARKFTRLVGVTAGGRLRRAF